MTVELIDQNYIPSEDEEFMNPKQIEYFRNKLLQWEIDLQKEITLLNNQMSDIRDKYTADHNESANLINMLIVIEKNKFRNLKLIDKIHYSLKKITNGTYGICERTGKPISIKRLISRPIATLCLEAQAEHENE